MNTAIDMKNTGIKMPGFLDKRSKFVKHQFNGPFIPLANPPILKKKSLPKILVCKSNKLYKEFGISKGKEIRVEVEEFNLISFYDAEIKKIRYISLSSKQMKKFKEVK